MTLVEESAMKQSTTGRHCEERSDEAIQKSTTLQFCDNGRLRVKPAIPYHKTVPREE
jgi:hypothetical protein